MTAFFFVLKFQNVFLIVGAYREIGGRQFSGSNVCFLLHFCFF